MKKYNSFLGAFFSGDSGQGGYNAAYEKKSLANLYGGNLAPEQEQEALSGLNRVNPEAAGKWQEETLKKSSQLLLALGKDHPLAIQAWQTRIRPNVGRMFGAQADSLPDRPDDSVMAVAQQIVGTSQGALPSDVQSFEYFTKDMTPEQKRQARENKVGLNKNGDWKTTIDPDTKTPVQSNGLGGFRYFDFNTRQWIDISGQGQSSGTPTPTQTTGSVPPPTTSGGKTIVTPQDIQGAAQRTGAVMQQVRAEIAQLVDQGVPVDQATSQVTQKYAQSRGLTMPTVGQQPAPVQQTAPPVAQTAPPPITTGWQGVNPLAKPDPKLTPYQQEQLALQQQAAARAEQAAKDAAAIRTDNKAAKDREAQARVADAKQTTDLLLSNVRELRKHPGFGQLGTFSGNARDAAIPEFVPTDYRGAKARLDTIKGQIAIQAMASLKTLSSSGATGFGALSEKELGLLQGSIQTLTTSQNNADIVAALDQIEKYLTKAGQAKAAPGGESNSSYSTLWGD